MKKILILLAIALSSLTSCSKKFETESGIRLSGTIQKLEMTTYQYGTHLLKAADTSYALTSKTVNLDLSVGKKVSIKGTRVKGYPIEGGPALIEVHQVD